jgi:DNA-binding GntR family transcriptional regulator
VKVIEKLMEASQINPGVLPRSLGEEAYQLLRDQILSGRLAPDERLRFRQLAEQMNIGIAALREALNRLISERLVILEPQRGFRVAPASMAELRDICELRIELTLAALGSSIRLGDENWEANIVASLHRLTRTALPKGADDIVTTDAWEERHEAFHRSLIAACDSPWRLHFCAALSSQFQRYRRMIILRLGRSEATASRVEEEHKAIAAATVARDVAQASKLLREHFEWSRDYFLENYR